MKFIIFPGLKKLPERKHYGDVGYDCYLPNDIEIPANSVLSVDLKVGINLKNGEGAILCMRSSIAKYNLIANTSPIDTGYKGSIHLIVHNLNNKPVQFYTGDRICQIVIIKTRKEFFHFKKELRKDKGFGSSGK